MFRTGEVMPGAKINILTEELANRIAAGEVVERPASVVKELVENSLDAGATEISVWLEKSGVSLIRVGDDGEGIAPEDLPLALERHSTSKLKEEDDLFRISTLGFRGEALPSIAAVSKLDILSRPPGTEIGYRLRAEGGKSRAPVAAGCAVGTSVEIRELFYNTPARRKFLRSPATELSHVCDAVNRMALAFPGVHFRLYHNGRSISDYAAVREPKDRLHQIFGPEIANSLVPFSGRHGSLEIGGYLSSAPASFSSARYLITLVNQRYVRDRILTHAVLQGYETLLMKGRYPAAVIELRVPFDEVDVNVHPAKYEVRFRHQSQVHDSVSEAVRQALKREAKAPTARVVAEHWESGLQVKESPLLYVSPRRNDDNAALREMPLTPALSPTGERREGFFSSMNILDQIFGCYLVCSSSRGLAVIDQHAAHERVTFEKMRHQLQLGGVERQNLLIPQTVELPSGEALLLEPRLSLLARLGFIVENFGPNTFAVTAVPALLPEGNYVEIVKQMIAEFGEVDHSDELRKELEERLATIACHSVIRANRRMEREEIRALLVDLDQVDFATQCPHGRPVLLEFTENELEKMFKRV